MIDTCKDDSKTTLGKDVRPESQRMDANISDEACNNNYVLFNPSRETTDYIGAFHNYLNGSSKGTCEFGGSPQLDLSLERSHPSGLWNQHTEERRTLGHSNSSAFKRWGLISFSRIQRFWLLISSSQKLSNQWTLGDLFDKLLFCCLTCLISLIYLWSQWL